MNSLLHLNILTYDNRSGSTLLASLLSQYENIRMMPESAFLVRLLESSNKIDSYKNLDHLWDFLNEEIQFKELNIDKVYFINSLKGTEITVENVVRKIIESYFKEDIQPDLQYILKTSVYSHFDKINQVFPDLEFIHIIRDGRAVFNSKKKSKSISGKLMQTNVVMAALDWKWKINKAQTKQYKIHNVKYESLVKDTDNELERLLQKIGVKNLNKISNSQDYFNSIGKEQKHLHFNLSKKPSAEHIGKWQKELNDIEIGIYNLINKKELNQFEYKIENDSPAWKIVLFLFFNLILLIGNKLKNITVLSVNPKLLRHKFQKRINLLR